MRPIRDAARVDGNHADAVEGSLIAKCFRRRSNDVAGSLDLFD